MKYFKETEPRRRRCGIGIPYPMFQLAPMAKSIASRDGVLVIRLVFVVPWCISFPVAASCSAIQRRKTKRGRKSISRSTPKNGETDRTGMPRTTGRRGTTPDVPTQPSPTRDGRSGSRGGEGGLGGVEVSPTTRPCCVAFDGKEHMGRRAIKTPSSPGSTTLSPGGRRSSGGCGVRTTTA